MATAFDGPVVPDVKNRAMSCGSADAPGGAFVEAEFSASASASPWTRTDLRVSTRSATSARRAFRWASVTTTAVWDSRSACKRKSPLLAAFTAAGTAPMRAAPSQKYTHSGQVVVNSATVSPLLTPSAASTLAAAHDRSRISANVTGVPAIDIITRSPNCSARRSSTAATVKRSTPNAAASRPPSRSEGITPPLPPGRARRRRCTRSRSWMARCPGRTGAPTAAVRRSPAPPRERGWASRDISCFPK